MVDQEKKALFLSCVQGKNIALMGSFKSNLSFLDIFSFEVSFIANSYLREELSIDFFEGKNKIYFLQEKLSTILCSEFLIDVKNHKIKFYYGELNIFLILNFKGMESNTGNFNYE